MRAALITAVLCASAQLAAAAPSADPKTKSKAVTDSIIEAVVAEMERSQKKLSIPGAPTPYFFGYKLTEVEVNDVSASLGALTGERDRHFVNLETHVHVGDYARDNSNFLDGQNEDADGVVGLSLPLEATPELARRAVWRTTDAAYKEAIAQIRTKEAQLRKGAAGGVTKVPSYSRVKPVVSLAPVLVAALDGTEDLGKRASKVSAYFRGKKNVRTSRVAFTSFLERRWYVNSEGTRVHDTRRVSGVLITVSGQAADGQDLNLYFSRYGIVESDLPNDDELLAEAKRLTETLDKLRDAPVIDDYAGPVLFEDDAAADIVRYSLARNLSGTPLPVGIDPDGEGKRFGGSLLKRLKLTVLPKWLSVTDDPTTNRFGNRRLIGGYKIDDEGVPAAKVQVVRNGRLEELLMSRTPSAKIGQSNGHARLSMPGGVYRGSPTNTIVTSRNKLSTAALEKKMIAEIKATGRPYGLIVNQLDDPAITSNPEINQLELIRLWRAVSPDGPPPALLAYRLYPNGKRELVRGVQVDPFEIGAWKSLVATGSTNRIKNFLASTDTPLLARARGVGSGFVPSGGVESAVITPDLLFGELEVSRSTLGRRPRPIVPRP
jgi:predicted Zn-dependent protease